MNTSEKSADTIDWQKGCRVQVRAFGCWYPGKVVSVGPKLIKAEFTTGGFGGNTKTRTFLPSHVVPDRTFVICRRGEPDPGTPDYFKAIERRTATVATYSGQAVSR